MASGYMFSHYWPGDGLVGTPPPTTQQEIIYPYYFNGSQVSMFLGVDWTWFRPRLKATWLALRMIWGGDFGRSLAAVREVAHDPSSRKLDSWAPIAREMVSNPKVAENTMRHLAAQLKIGGPNSAVLAELAYRAYRKER